MDYFVAVARSTRTPQGWSLELRVRIRKVGKLNAHLTPRWSARVEDKSAKLKLP